MATTPASIDGHPIHSILVAFPIGLWTFSLVCDLMYRFGSGEPLWHSMASYALVTGIIGALAAAVPGLIDFFSITDPRAGKVAVAHLEDQGPERLPREPGRAASDDRSGTPDQ